MTLTCSPVSEPAITSFVWYSGGTPVTGETSATISFTNIQPASAAVITCEAFIDTVASHTSAAFDLTVLGKNIDFTAWLL